MSVVDVNAIVLKLIAVGRSAVAADVQVLDGRDYSDEPGTKVLLVGYSGSPSSPVVDVTRSLAEGGVSSSLWDVEVRCTVAAWNGDEEFATKRATAQGIINAFNTALEANRHLDGTAYEAWLSPQQQWFQVADTEGNSVEADLTVTVQVFA